MWEIERAVSSPLLSSPLVSSPQPSDFFSGYKKHFATNILQPFFICLCAWLGRGQTHSQCCIYIQPHTVAHKFWVLVDFACISVSCVVYFEPLFLSSILSNNPSRGKHAKIVQRMYDCNKANSVSSSSLFLACFSPLLRCCVLVLCGWTHLLPQVSWIFLTVQFSAKLRRRIEFQGLMYTSVVPEYIHCHYKLCVMVLL